MTVLRFSAVIAVAALFAATAFGQYGLYGSPDLVELPSTESASPVSTVGYAVPTFQPRAAQPQQPIWHQPQAQPTFPLARRPLLQSTEPMVRRPLLQPAPAVPQQYAVPRYAAAPQFATPRYAVPGMVQPHPAVANYYTPEAPKPAEQLQQAIPVPPTPPGMSDPSPSPSDAIAAPEATGSAPMSGDYLDYNTGWGYCGAAPQTFSGYGGSCGEACGAPYPTCDTGCRECPWYGGVAALFLSRNSANRLWTSYEHGNFPNQLMNSDMIGLKWQAGGEVKIGRRFGCGCGGCGSVGDGCGGDGCGGDGCGGDGSSFSDWGVGGPWALQATYFTMTPFSGYHSVTHANGVSSVLTVGNVFFHGANATDWFDQARRHELWRRNEIHSAEISFVRSNLPWLSGSRFDCDFEFGVRYFRFWEHLMFGTLAGAGRVNPAWAQRAYLEDKVSNDLLGFQFGVNMGYWIHPSCRIFATPKFGVYNNHIDHYFVARLSDGTIGTVTSPSGESFPSQSNTNVLSFLTQIDVGLDWQVTQRLSAQVGYRAIVATGIALSDHQIPHFVNDIPEYRNIEHNGDLLLHGAFAGVTFNY